MFWNTADAVFNGVPHQNLQSLCWC